MKKSRDTASSNQNEVKLGYKKLCFVFQTTHTIFQTVFKFSMILSTNMKKNCVKWRSFCPICRYGFSFSNTDIVYTKTAKFSNMNTYVCIVFGQHSLISFCENCLKGHVYYVARHWQPCSPNRAAAKVLVAKLLLACARTFTFLCQASVTIRTSKTFY